MQIDQIVESIGDALNRSGFVQIEISARHVHLTNEATEILFGKGKTLTPKRELSQPMQYLSEERVKIIGPKGSKSNVAVLGPVRQNVQVELSKSDCISLGIKAPIRESGDIKGSGRIKLEGPCGSLEISEGVIIARAHIHITPDISENLGLCDKQIVSVEVLSERPVVYKNVIVRVSKNFKYRMHVDFDEANAAEILGFTLGKIIKEQ